MSNVTGFFLFTQDGWLATWLPGQTQLIQRSTGYLYGTKSFSWKQTSQLLLDLVRLVFVRQVSQQGWPSGHVYKGDTDIFQIAKTCTQYLHVSRPAHSLLHSLDLSTYTLQIPASHTHTHKHTTQSLSPTPFPLHRNFCMWTTHTTRCRYVTKQLFFVQ